MQGDSITVATRALHQAAVDANFFTASGVHTKASGALAGDLIFSLRRFDYVLTFIRLFRCAHKHLAAIDDDAHVRTLPVFSAFIVANNDGAVRANYNRRSVSHADARTTIGLRLHCVARIKLKIIVS